MEEALSSALTPPRSASPRARRHLLSRAAAGSRLALGFAVVGSVVVSSAACVSKPNEDPSLDRTTEPPRFGPASKLSTTFPELPPSGPLTLAYNANHPVLKHAVAVEEHGWLHVVASASEAQTCEDLYPKKAAWLEVRLDAGPTGDFYADTTTPVTYDFSLPGDNADWREAHPSAARAHLSSLTSENPTLRVEFKRALLNPDPKVPTVVTGAGTVDVTVCPSALELLAKSHPSVPDQGPATATFGDETFPIRSALVFVFDDGKNGATVNAMNLYEAEHVSCDAASRWLSDKGGGIPGRQVQVGPLPLGTSRKPASVFAPTLFEGWDLITGEKFFQVRYLTRAPMRGYVKLTYADLTENPPPNGGPTPTPPPATSGVAGVVHVEGPDGRVSGSFEASICKRNW